MKIEIRFENWLCSYIFSTMLFALVLYNCTSSPDKQQPEINFNSGTGVMSQKSNWRGKRRKTKKIIGYHRVDPSRTGIASLPQPDNGNMPMLTSLYRERNSEQYCKNINQLNDSSCFHIKHNQFGFRPFEFVVKGTKCYSYNLSSRGEYGLLGSHFGIDLGLVSRTPIYSAGDGVVVYRGYNSTYGKHVMVLHGCWQGRCVLSLYAHLASYLVKKQTFVKAGQLIAKSGNTGYKQVKSNGYKCIDMIRKGFADSKKDFQLRGLISNNSLQCSYKTRVGLHLHFAKSTIDESNLPAIRRYGVTSKFLLGFQNLSKMSSAFREGMNSCATTFRIEQKKMQTSRNSRRAIRKVIQLDRKVYAKIQALDTATPLCNHKDCQVSEIEKAMQKVGKIVGELESQERYMKKQRKYAADSIENEVKYIRSTERNYTYKKLQEKIQRRDKKEWFEPKKTKNRKKHVDDPENQYGKPV
ncbi:MAG: peptidoglycan DD-metalloendopeptidase family protein [Spirochaetota bacterium]